MSLFNIKSTSIRVVNSISLFAMLLLSVVAHSQDSMLILLPRLFISFHPLLMVIRLKLILKKVLHILSSELTVDMRLILAMIGKKKIPRYKLQVMDLAVLLVMSPLLIMVSN